ncbi:MAG: tRNA (adenosine(37)-N6)-dimethylallyltransferase MiaA [Actinomycetota bacterium]|nr:tRNA (adenosine(37)-N6)-dimethylallyltransferase MiaA [Actinomycetota bacterium]
MTVRPGTERVDTDRDRSATRIPLALVGPTATGKTEASLVLAERLGAEIMLIDSMTVYRGMDVGTAKPSAVDRRRVPHHLADVADPAAPFSVAAFQRLAAGAREQILDRGNRPFLVGGSGLYFRAVVDGLEFPGTDARLRRSLEAEAAALGPGPLHERLAAFDPAAAAKMEPSNARRVVRALEVAALTGRAFSEYAEPWDRYPEGRVRAAGVTVAADVLRTRIEARARDQLDGALLDEVRRLLASGLDRTARQAIGYAEAIDHLQGRLALDEAVERIVRRTRTLARRQLAWFRRDPRIRWFEADERGASGLIDELEEHYRG